MTIVKTTSVCSAAHLKNLRNYLDSEKAIYREVINLPNISDWEKQMAETRELYGHDKASRKGSKNTVLYHQILAFNADDCALNGKTDGMDLTRVMEYARRWCEREYPEQEVIMVAHLEHCEADNTDRWAVHLGINRSNLKTGLRYDPGLPQKAKSHRASIARELDAEFGLEQVERGKANSKIHRRQPSKAVREIEQRNPGNSEILAMKNIAEKALEEAKSDREKASVNKVADLMREEGLKVGWDAEREDMKLTNESGYSVKGSTVGIGLDYIREQLSEVRTYFREQIRQKVCDIVDKVIESDYVRTMFGMAQSLHRHGVKMDYEDKGKEVSYTYDGETFAGSEVGASREAMEQVFSEKDAKFGGKHEQRERIEQVMEAHRSPNRDYRARDERDADERQGSLIDSANDAYTARQQEHDDPSEREPQGALESVRARHGQGQKSEQKPKRTFEQMMGRIKGNNARAAQSRAGKSPSRGGGIGGR